MSFRVLTILGMCGLAAPAIAEFGTSPPAQPVASREILLSFAADQPELVKAVQVYASDDGGRTWRPIESERVESHRVRCVAPADGRFDFFIVLENEHGASSSPPVTGTPPHASVMIDTLAPTLQLHSGTVGLNPAGLPVLTLSLTLIEEQLCADGVRLFYRAHNETGAWADAGDVAYADGSVSRVLPDDVPAKIDVRVVATDRAGNRTLDELRGVAVRDVTEPRIPVRLAERPSDGGTMLAADFSVVHPPKPLALGDPTDADTQSEPPDDASPPAIELPSVPTPTVQALRLLAEEFSLRGELSLAGARLTEALDIQPADPDLLSDMGSVLYRSRRYDDASESFRHALEAKPDHLGALEGLALVDVTQHRYPEARAHLEKLLELDPDTARHWLHLGDVNHKLGDRTRAVDAWEHVLKLDGDIELRERANKRLRYFGPGRGASRP